MAWWMGCPVERSQTRVVSRWLVMPSAATSAGRAPRRASASPATPTWEDQISLASCSTQPGWGKICRNSFCAVASWLPSRSKTMARELVVPWSRARMYLDMLGGGDKGNDGWLARAYTEVDRTRVAAGSVSLCVGSMPVTGEVTSWAWTKALPMKKS